MPRCAMTTAPIAFGNGRGNLVAPPQLGYEAGLRAVAWKRRVVP